MGARSATEQLAIRMFQKMEHLDPTDDYDINKSPEENWAALSEHMKLLYLGTIKDLAAYQTLWDAAGQDHVMHNLHRQQFDNDERFRNVALPSFNPHAFWNGETTERISDVPPIYVTPTTPQASARSQPGDPDE